MRKLILLGVAAVLSTSLLVHGARPDGGGGGGGGQKGPPSGGGQNQRGPTSRPSPEQQFEAADTDHDGVLSKAEFVHFLETHRPPRPKGSPPQE